MAELEADRSLARAVAYRGGQRYVQSFERVRPDSRSNPKLRQGGVYLITGGLGGLGLTVAQRLAERFQAKLVLVGRRAPSIDSVVKRLKRIEAVGGELLVVAADVTDSEAMEGVVRAATERFGVLNGVVHAAGVLEDGLIDLKQPEAASRVLAPKVTGTMVLDSAVEGLDLDFMVLFSSTGAALGLPGQVDYTGANAFENAFAHSKVSSKTPTIALGWGPWLEVGMAARVADESSPLSSLSPTSEVDHPFLDVCIKATSEEILYSTQYSLDDHWLVREHQIEGLGALMPGTGYLEMASASFEHTCSSGGLEIRDVLFTAPFRIGGKERQELRVSLRPVNGHYSFLFSSLKSDGQTVEHAQGELQDLSEAPKAAVSLQSIRARCTPATNGCAVNPHFRFGPRWSNLKRIELGRREALATIELPAEFQDDLRRITLHPALLDIATSCGLPLVEGFDPDREFYVPVSCSSVQVHRALPRALSRHVRLRSDSTEREFVSFDVDLLDGEGRVLVAIDEFTFRRATNASLSRLSSAPARAGASGPAAAPREQGRAAPMGISPAKGAEAFEIALNFIAGEPEIIVSHSSINDQIHELDGTHGAVRTSSKSVERANAEQPAADADSGSERDEVEQRIWEIWQPILGGDNLGNDDNFFDLGADSLSALKAVALIKREFKIKLSISQLYEHPTVQQLASLIRHELGEGEAA